MKDEGPYRAAGTFAGPAYVERDADVLLLAAIHKNHRYPYIVAPRQSGKSSLILRVRASLPPEQYRTAFVDLSTLDNSDYEKFWRAVLTEISYSADLPASAVTAGRPEDTILAWLCGISVRLTVFFDEIDALVGAGFRDQFFSKLRSLFNKRAEDRRFERLSIVLAGAAHPTQLITDQMRSPFNVGIEIRLDDLTPARVKQLVSHIDRSGATVGLGVEKHIHDATGGSVYLAQLLLERLWVVGEHRGSIDIADVDRAVTRVIEGAPLEIHFQNIYRIIIHNVRLMNALSELRAGRRVDESAAQDLRLAGISDGDSPYRNKIYREVFGAGGPLALHQTEPASATRGSVETSVPGDGVRISPPITETTTDEELLGLYRDGHRQAADVLVRRHYSNIRRFVALKLRTSVAGLDADDCAQRAFMKALQLRGDVRNFRQRLYLITYNMVINTLRLNKKATNRWESVSEELLDQLGDSEFDIDLVVERRMMIERITLVLPSLPVESQVVLELVYWKGLTIQEVASLLEVSIGTVKSRLYRARDELARRAELGYY